MPTAMPDWLYAFWPLMVAALSLAASIATSVHILIHRHDPRGSLAWIGLVWLVPVAGVMLYVMFGINRIVRRARLLRTDTGPGAPLVPEPVANNALPAGQRWRELRVLMDRINDTPLLGGNRIDMLASGETCYARMLAAIDGARYSVGLVSYILANDACGARFVEALAAAVRRGVQVRVLVDGIGQYYSLPPITRRLRRAGIPCALFIHSLLPWRMPYLNLRNHRKILVVDGGCAFTGGMNISAVHAGSPPAARDIHFQVTGPVVRQMVQVFVDDWAFTTGEQLAGPAWYGDPPAAGKALLRGVADGPDEDYGKCRWAMLAGLAAARRRVLVGTPYFLPDDELVMALCHAALRGVRVDIVLPGRNNWAIVQWASNTLLDRLLQSGCRIWFGAGGFDHSKYLVVDAAWCLLGSANWDPRSLRLNFEFNLEVFDPSLAMALTAYADAVVDSARALRAGELRDRSVALRLRDGLARLLSPYL